MKPTKTTARLAGVLFLIQLIPYYIAHDSILGSILYASNYLTEINKNRHQVSMAVLLELSSALAFLGFSIILYRIFKKSKPGMALGYIGLRFVEFGIIVLSEIKLMSLVAVGRQFTEAEGESTSFVQAVGDSILAEWEWTTLLYMIVFCLNALLFYFLLFKTRLVPRFISVWGFLGGIIALAVPVSIMFEAGSGSMFFYIPIGFNELLLAIWLIVKGFGPMEFRSMQEDESR